MKSKIFGSDNLNNIIYIVLLLVIVLIVCFKSISIHQSIMEQFANDDVEETVEEAINDALDTVADTYNQDDQDEDLEKKCAKIETNGFGSITSKYSGKTINVETLPPVKGAKRKYIIKWQPIGGKPGGCITANADGTYSTPICNANINKQLWFIKEIKNEEEYLKIIPKDRQTMGRSMDETEFPFHIVQSSEYENYCLHYEGGGLGIREIANYDAQKWDVSKDKITQDPIPAQNNSKFVGLTPDHRMTQTDRSLGSVGENPNGGDGKNPMQFNINLDPDLLAKMGVNTGLSNGGENGVNVKGEGGLLISDEEANARKMNGDTSDMILNGESCDNCGKVPENMIKKDMVKSMCIGCNNIDNVLE